MTTLNWLLPGFMTAPLSVVKKGQLRSSRSRQARRQRPALRLIAVAVGLEKIRIPPGFVVAELGGSVSKWERRRSRLSGNVVDAGEHVQWEFHRYWTGWLNGKSVQTTPAAASKYLLTIQHVSNRARAGRGHQRSARVFCRWTHGRRSGSGRAGEEQLAGVEDCCDAVAARPIGRQAILPVR